LNTLQVIGSRASRLNTLHVIGSRASRLNFTCHQFKSFKIWPDWDEAFDAQRDVPHIMLAGVHLESRFWPYYFCHFLHLYNATPHCSHDASPFTICSGCLPDLSYLHTFGCQVYVLPLCATCPDTRTGVSLGYSQAMQDILYYDLNSPQVKPALHLVFDEAMTDFDDKTLNAWLLHGNTVLPKEILDLTSDFQHLNISLSPFTAMVTIEICYDPNDHFPFGFYQATCTHLCWAYFTDFT